jgi:phosphatidylglycerol---prolipoprotein diacylglyceryl transferase
VRSRREKRHAAPPQSRADQRIAGPTAPEPEALVITGSFDSGAGTEPYSAVVRFRGRRAGIHGKEPRRDAFVHDERIDGIVPGTGPVSVSAWVYDREPDEWAVDAELVTDSARGTRPPAGARSTRTVRPVTWSWRHWALVQADGTVKTRWAPLAPLAAIPAVVPGSYPLLATVSIVVALWLQALIVAAEGLPAGQTLVVSLLAVAAGLVGAKIWYVVLHPDEPLLRTGWAVDGFLVIAPLVALAGLVAFDLPIGAVLDAAAPGLFFAVAIGRIGCFLAGCCAGRATRSRWGIWSSDRRVGMRRVPTQLMESLAGASIGVVTLALVLNVAPPVHGLVFVGGLGVYAAVRQGLLRLRSEQRTSHRTLPLTAGAAAVVLVLVAGVSLGQPNHQPPHPVTGATAQYQAPS